MKFVCPVCGYVEEFDGDELPADYKCPQCGCPGSRCCCRFRHGFRPHAGQHSGRQG